MAWKYRVKLRFLEDYRLGRANFVLIYGSLAKILETQGYKVHRVIPFSNLLGISPLQPSRRGSKGDVRWFYVLAFEDIEQEIRSLRQIHRYPVEILEVRKREVSLPGDPEPGSPEPRISSGHFPVEIASGRIIFPSVSDLVFPLLVFMHRFGILGKNKLVYKAFKKVLSRELVSYKISFYHYERESRTFEYTIFDLSFSERAVRFYPGYWLWLNHLSNILGLEP